ncbi:MULTISPECIES: excisionase family protein [Salinivibrio]|uniref:Excisionase family protein n=1 Tax=Salinivibrio proteolyticus TaxID=334715 RepID=A0ABY7LEI9_9GAMM|nr:MULTISPECIES: excisionase family protein [Salinivibrio]PCE67579.1 hypothetical protein B6G00_04325 [Salinivibrio sp. YCSC6]QCF35517.1 excisionase [Salinivibrio sp. YCSC6]WBA13890.1 excisionase family protein [Salinivibrio proteolyticus]
MTTLVELVQPNDWVEEKMLSQLTGLGRKTIEEFRLNVWIEGVEFIKVSPSGRLNARKVLYNRKAIDKSFYNYQRIA